MSLSKIFLDKYNLSNTLLSLKDSRDYIHSLIKASLGSKYSYLIAEKELKLIEKLHPANCKTLISKGICTGYCKPEYKKRCEDESLLSTSPLHSQVAISLNLNESLSENILEKIDLGDNDFDKINKEYEADKRSDSEIKTNIQ